MDISIPNGNRKIIQYRQKSNNSNFDGKGNTSALMSEKRSNATSAKNNRYETNNEMSPRQDDTLIKL
jgi:hypothetical protein